MKRLSGLLSFLVFISLIIFTSCSSGDDDSPSLTDAQQAAVDLTANTWVINDSNNNVRYNNEISDFDWNGFTLNFTLNANGSTNGSYSTNVQNVTPTDPDGNDATDVWAQTESTWSVSSRTALTKDETAAGMVLTDTQLTLTFTISAPPARESGVFDQEWIFIFSAQ
ncbi:MAG: hypothetical protein AAF620_02805 [Bacteroidota bacterium]